ncbi:MAG TPA: hypothetical protein VIB48_05515 [Acidimicrobiia bacterium]
MSDDFTPGEDGWERALAGVLDEPAADAFDIDREWRALAPRLVRARRVRRVRTGVVAVACVAALGAVAYVAPPLGGGHRRTGIATQPGPAPRATDALVAVPPEPVVDPALTRLLALPSCHTAGDYPTWAVSAIAPYAHVDASTFRSLPLREVATALPLPTDVPGASCAVSGVFGDAWGWELQSGSGAVLARGIGVPSGPVVPERMTSHIVTYHQETIGSGQPLSGFIEGDRVEAVIADAVNADRIVVLEMTGRSVRSEAEGVALERHLSLAERVPIEPAAGLLPTRVPPGFHRCLADFGPPVSTTAARYCDGRGATIVVSSFVRSVPAGGHPVVVAGRPATADRTARGPRLSVEISRGAGVVSAQGPDDVTEAQLVGMLASVPVVAGNLGR